MTTVGMTESVLLVGLGQIGMGYDLSSDSDDHIYTHARAFSFHPSFELSAAVDPSDIKRTLFKSHYGKPAYGDLKEALERHQARIVVIAGPTESHGSLVEQVLQYSAVEVILCEKPLAYGLQDAREIVARCHDAGVTLFVNYVRRVDKGFLEVKRRFDEDLISTPVKGSVWYSNGFLNNGSHFFNLLEFWLGGLVLAKIVNRGRYCGKNDVEPDVYVEFERGKVMFQAVGEEIPSHYSLEILGPSGRLGYKQGQSDISWQPAKPHPWSSRHTVFRAEPEVIEGGMQRYQWHVADHLARYLDSKSQKLCTGDQALATLEAMHQIINLR